MAATAGRAAPASRPEAAPAAGAPAPLADRLLDALPQTQCRRCGYADCRDYAEAIARGEAGIDRCPPGGLVGIGRLAAASGRSLEAAPTIDAACGSEGPRRLARIDEAACIGCALCLPACPVDAIVGARQRTHTVIAAHCTGCELCVPACPVDCIAMARSDSEATGWAAWSDELALEARLRYEDHARRVGRNAAPSSQ